MEKLNITPEELTSFLDYAKEPLNLSQISYRFGLYVDDIEATINQNPSLFTCEEGDYGQPYYSPKKDEPENT